MHQNCTDVNQPTGGDGLDERDESANTPVGSADSQHAGSSEVDGLPSIRRYYQMQAATQKQYTVYIKKWAIFCGARKIAPYIRQI